MSFTRRVYAGPSPDGKLSWKTPESPGSPATPLSARTFGTWTLLQAIVRLYAAYNIHNPSMYQLAMWTYAIAFGHFASEWLYFKTARFGEALAPPVLISTGSLIWMWWSWSSYVR
jgi:hypothetical protein